MGFCGHVFDMINRMKYNDSLKRARRDRYKNHKDSLDLGGQYSEFHDWNKLPEKDLNLLKIKIRNQIIKERRARMIPVIIIMTIVTGLIFAAYSFLL